MLDPAIRRRLSDIARGKTPHPSPSSHVEQPLFEDSTYSPVIPSFTGLATANQHGECLAHTVNIDSFHRDAVQLAEGFRSMCPGLRCDPNRVMLLDLETTGLYGRPLFLIGAMRMNQSGFQIHQLFARNYAEEKSVLCEFQRLTADCQALVTFNGTTFDLPFVRDRLARHRLNTYLPARHIDILTLARTRWKGRFPNCKLQTLESFVCGRHRTGDIPGHLIPEVYHQYVKSGDIDPLLPVFDHNALDLLTTLELCLALFGEAA